MTHQHDICGHRSGANANSFLAHRHGLGRRKPQAEKIYRWLVEYGPATCEELSLRLSMRYTSVSARLAELKRDRWVAPSGAERKTTGGEKASVMRAIGEAERDRLLNPKRAPYQDRQAELFA